MPDGTTRFSHEGQPIFHYILCSTFSNFTVLPEIAVAKIREDALFKTSSYVGCGVTTGVGTVINTAKVQVGDTVACSGSVASGSVCCKARGLRARGLSSVSILTRTVSSGASALGMTHFVNPKTVDGDIVQHLVALTDSGADYMFDCTGNTTVMRQALEGLPSRLGYQHRHRRGRRGQRNIHPPLPAGHRPQLAGNGFRRRSIR